MSVLVFSLVLVGVLLVAVVLGARRERPHDGRGRRSDGHLHANVVAAGGLASFGGDAGAGCGDGGGSGC